jgi:transcriptional regulator with XRE-family HTH domain
MPLANSETAEHVRATLGAILRRRREINERSLHDVAAPAGISAAFLSEVERGRKEISTERLLKLCTALQTTIGDVYLELAGELGAAPRGQTWAVAAEADPRLQLQRMTRALGPDALRLAARFTTFLALSEPAETASRKRPIGFMR